ncbi:MAG: outer membrane protein assembly factor BamE [Burkholderiales bacterium]|nr:outer membrane protein assembly factor BamE [Burkholderiales bacterium]
MSKWIVIGKVCAALALSAVAAGCATKLGRNFDETYAEQIKSGETTKAEVLDRLGRPVIRHASGGEETWTYAYYDGPGFGTYVNTAQEDLQYGLGKQSRLIIVFKGDVVRASRLTREIPHK